MELNQPALGVSTFGARTARPAPIKTKDLEANSSASSYWTEGSNVAASPALRLNRDRLNELLSTLAAQNKGSSLIEIFKQQTEKKKQIRNFFLADIRRETQIVTIKRGENPEHNTSRAEEATSPSLPPSSARRSIPQSSARPSIPQSSARLGMRSYR